MNQPGLVSGGIMRSYQLDGMEWLKVRKESSCQQCVCHHL